MIYDKKTNTIRDKATIDESHDEFFGSLKSYPCHPSCKELWEDGKDYQEGVDYELSPLTFIAGDFNKLYACPITPIQEESEDELWQDVRENMILGWTDEQLKNSFTINRKV